MAFSLTFNTLQNNIMNYLQRSDNQTYDTIPMFIMLAQDRVDKDCKTLGLESYAQGTLTSGESVLQKPEDWRNTITFNILIPSTQERQQVLLRTYEFCRLYAPDMTKRGTPAYFCDYGFHQWLLAPTPDQDYEFEMAYMQSIIPIDANIQTNWLTQFAPELLFYACMLEAMIYLKDNDNLQYWQGMYQTAMQAMVGENKERYQDRYSDRTKD